MPDTRITIEASGSSIEHDQVRQFVLEHLREFNRQRAEPPEFQSFSLSLREGEALVGGLVGEIGWKWLFVELLWVAEPYRGRGLGASLLHAAEAEAMRRGAHHVYLDTFDFQARPFYERQGYEVFGVLEDYPPGHRRFFLRKDLTDAGGSQHADPALDPGVSTMRISVLLDAPRERVYNALIEPQAVRQWMVPEGMTSQIHEFEAREGGFIRISLTYDEATGTGKTTSHTDTYHGNFMTLVPGRKVVQRLEFETDDPSMQGQMTTSFILRDVDGRTELLATHEGLPSGLSAVDNETGWRMSLAKLARLLESD